MNSIKDLKPTAIWQNFYKLTQVPRPSNHEEQARKFMLEWAKENFLLVGLFFIFVEFMILGRKNKHFMKINLFKR